MYYSDNVSPETSIIYGVENIVKIIKLDELISGQRLRYT